MGSLPTLEYAEVYITPDGEFWFAESYREFSILTPLDEEFGVAYTASGHLQSRHIEIAVESLDY